jgi:hypothetical protein
MRPAASGARRSEVDEMHDRQMKMATRTIAIILLAAAGGLAAEPSSTDLAEGFRSPGVEARPRAYWNWLNGDVSLPDLTRDLEEAKAKGLGGLEMWDTEAMQNPDGFVPAGPPFMGPESVAAMRHSIREAKRLGLELGLITSSGWNAGGPWVPPAMASKNLFVAEVTVAGPGEIKRKLPFPALPRDCPRRDDGMPQWSLDVAVLAWPDTADKRIPDRSQVIDLTHNVKDGELVWTAPAGNWRVARFVCSNNGQQLIAASPNSKGPFIDFLDPEATRFHFEYIIHKLGLEKGGDPSPLKYLEVDSMELHPGIQWTPKFPEWFKRQHGYDPLHWLPALAGWTMGDETTSERFRYDYRKSVSDLLIFSHYTTGSRVCAEYGLQLAGEAGGPGPPIWNTCPVDALKALGNVDIPRGEFWIRHRNMFLVKEIASAANIYGKPYVDAEAWTTWRRWNNSPFVLKQIVDRAFCEGLNRITYHGFSHSPPGFGFPGRSYHAGTDMNPRVVWWSKARPFMDYLARCCHMLQQGRFVADVAYFYGDQAPNFWPMHHDVPEKPLLPGLGAGYDYDVVNSDVILNRMSVKDGRIHLVGGMSYRVLVLPNQPHMPLEILQKLDRLVRRGATILGPKPSQVPGLHDHEQRTAELRRLADAMWGAGELAPSGENRRGRGRVVWGMTARQWLGRESVGPDFSCLDAAMAPHLDYIHRRTRDADIYFVRNKSLQAVKADGLFRVTGRTPQFWHPEDGRIEPAFVHRVVDGSSAVRLDLPPGGSLFVVFTGESASARIGALTLAGGNDDPSLPAARVVAADASSATVRCWRNGDVVLEDGAGKSKRVAIDTIPEPRTVEGSWAVAFDPAWGAPAEIEFPRLISWTAHPDAGVKYYSGAGTYRKTIDVPADWLGTGQKVFLDLGEVREVAEVFINGQSAGVLWKPPFRVDATALVRPGANELKIEVMNLWINRLVGDHSLPPNERLTRTNIRRGQEWEIHPAGLLGPVRLLPARDVVIR